MNLSRYRERKTKKLTKLQKVGKKIVLSSKVFDSLTGKERLEEDTIDLRVDILETKRAEFQEYIAELDALLLDIKSLK